MRAKDAFIQCTFYLLVVLGALMFLAFSWTSPTEHAPAPIREATPAEKTEQAEPPLPKQRTEKPATENTTPPETTPEETAEVLSTEESTTPKPADESWQP